MNNLLKKSYEFLKEKYRENMDITDKTKVLDIGCGKRGNFLGLPGCVYTGIDNNKRVICALKRKANGHYQLMAAEDLEFEDDFFDYVISTSFFHHCSITKIFKVAKQIEKVLKDSGKIIIADGIYPESRDNIIGWGIRFFDRGRFVRKKDEFRALFEKIFLVEQEFYFIDRFFAYSVLVMRKK